MRLQCVPCQDSRGFIKRLVTGWLAAAQIIVIHRRQVVMNQ